MVDPDNWRESVHSFWRLKRERQGRWKVRICIRVCTWIDRVWVGLVRWKMFHGQKWEIELKAMDSHQRLKETMVELHIEEQK